jgi:hypothetical protein
MVIALQQVRLEIAKTAADGDHVLHLEALVADRDDVMLGEGSFEGGGAFPPGSRFHEVEIVDLGAETSIERA